jgi:hypothetical protein
MFGDYIRLTLWYATDPEVMIKIDISHVEHNIESGIDLSIITDKHRVFTKKTLSILSPYK